MTTSPTKTSEPKRNRGRQPGDILPGSFVSRLCEMEVGECEARATRIPFKKATGELIRSTKESLGATIRKASHRATERSDNQYSTVTTNDFRQDDDFVYIVAAITRTA